MTSGAFSFGLDALPSRITVSPLKTLLTRATPLEGRIVGRRGAVVVSGILVEAMITTLCFKGGFSFGKINEYFVEILR